MTAPADRFSTLCVYCASSPGADPEFARTTDEFGRRLARDGIRLVYGGASVGLMGVLADAVLDEGGEVHGVITEALVDQEIAHLGLSELVVVDTMHERKAAMADRADGFVMLPGGFGTLDEFMEAVTWTQLGIHSKPCGVLNTRGFFGPLEALLETAVHERLVRPEHRSIVMFDEDPVALLDEMRAWTPATVDKWIDRTAR